MMMKPILIIIATTMFFQFSWSQENDSLESNKLEQFTIDFFELIKKSDFNKAYTMCAKDFKERISEIEFKVHFEAYKKYYGDLINITCMSKENCFYISANTAMAAYDVEFEYVNTRLMIRINVEDEKNPLMQSYYFTTKDFTSIPKIEELSKNHIKKLNDNDFIELYELLNYRSKYDSFEEFQNDLNRLIVNDKFDSKYRNHNMYPYENTIDLTIYYEINGIGDIVFEYKEENGEVEFTNLRFYFTKEIEEAYNKSFKEFLDTTSLINENEILTAKDSFKLKREFDIVYEKIQEEKRNKELEDILEQSSSLSSLSSLFGTELSIRTSYDWDQLDSTDQKLIKKSSEQYLIKLSEKDVKGFWETSHSMFKESTPYVSFEEIGTIVSNIVQSGTGWELIDAKKVDFETKPTMSHFTTGGSTDKNNPNYLQFHVIPGAKTQALCLYKIQNSPLSKMITMKMGLEENCFKLLSCEINTCSVEGKDAVYFKKLASNLEKDNKIFSSFICYHMAYRLSYLGKGTSTKLSLDLIGKIKELQADKKLLAEIKKWQIIDIEYDIINIDFIETQNDITPNIIYISKGKLGKKPTGKEAEKLFEYLRKKHPELVEEFKVFSFTAYEEYPAVATKQYKYYRVILDINDL